MYSEVYHKESHLLYCKTTFSGIRQVQYETVDETFLFRMRLNPFMDVLINEYRSFIPLLYYLNTSKHCLSVVWVPIDHDQLSKITIEFYDYFLCNFFFCFEENKKARLKF